MASILNKLGTFGNVIRVNTNAIPLHCAQGPLKEFNLKSKYVMDLSSSVKEGKLFKRNIKLWHSSVISGLDMPLQVRLVHTDVCKVPDFSNYRRNDTVDPHINTNEADRRAFAYMTYFGATVVCTLTAKELVTGFIEYLAPSTSVMAAASIEVDLSSIPEGKSAVFKWRNKPLFVKHRTAAEIEREAQVNLAELRHPQTDLERVQKPEWLILLGVCTHLGCVPIANAGDYNGYFCPCHGSHYDGSGRVRRGPAPENLEVPQYKFLSDTTVLVG